jgi:hypothetical protein
MRCGKEGTTRLDIDIVGASKMWIQIVDERDEVGWGQDCRALISHLTDRGTRSDEQDA